jgi:hypothetical protein
MNPCKECLVNSMCKKYCPKLLEHVEITTNLAIKGSLNSSIANFMRETVINDEVIEVIVNFYNLYHHNRSQPNRSQLNRSQFIHIFGGEIVNATQITQPIEQPTDPGLFYSYTDGTNGRIRVAGTRYFDGNEITKMYLYD